MMDSTNAQIARLNKLCELSMQLSGEPMEVFVKVARMIGDSMDMKVVCLSEIRGPDLYFLSIYVQGHAQVKAGSCPLAMTPCATVEQSKDIQVYQNVTALFPQAALLREHHAFAYCGFPSLDPAGNVVAVTCLLDERPRVFSDEDKALLRLFGQRIGLELERKHRLDSRLSAVAALQYSKLRFQRIGQNLLAERDRLRKILDGLSVFIALLDADGKVIEANRAPWATAEIRREDYIGIQFGESRAWTYDPAVHAQVRLALARAQRGEAVRYDVPILMANRIETIDFSLVPLLDGRGRIDQIVACGVNVSIRKNALESLRRSEERLELAIYGADLALWDWDIPLGAFVFSKRWAVMLGYRLEEIQPSYEAWKRLVHPDDLPNVMRAVNDNLDAKTSFFEVEYRILAKNKQWKWTLGRGKVVTRDANGNPLRVTGIDMDISSRKDLEERLRQKQEELYYAQRLTAAGELTAIVAHEINQPLGAINNYVGGALLRYPELLSANPDLSNVLEQTLRLAQRAIAVMSGIRALVRKQERHFEWVSLGDLAEDTLIPFRTELSNKQIRLRLDIPSGLPPLWCQRIHLQQVLLNLILNAIQAMDAPDCAQRKLSLRAKLTGKHKLQLTVGDTGPGIAPEIAARLFEPFVSTKAEGIGLGLSICRTIADAYGWHITVRSTDRQGTLFYVVLPVVTDGEKHGY
jgi:signal transduction histidine kinase/GAF domain-containing protein